MCIKYIKIQFNSFTSLLMTGIHTNKLNLFYYYFDILILKNKKFNIFLNKNSPYQTISHLKQTWRERTREADEDKAKKKTWLRAAKKNKNSTAVEFRQYDECTSRKFLTSLFVRIFEFFSFKLYIYILNYFCI